MGRLLFPVLLIILGCGPRSPRALDDPPAELGRKLRASDVNTRRDAAFTLSRLAAVGGTQHGAGNLAAEKPALRDALRDSDSVTRVFAAHALADMGEADEAVGDVYRAAMSDADSWARAQACCGVRKDRRLLAASIPVVGTGLDDTDAAVVWEAAQSLAKCESIADRDILDKLLMVARRSRDTPGLQEDAVRALGKADAAHAGDVLERLRSVECQRSQHFDVLPVKEEAITSLAKRAGINQGK